MNSILVDIINEQITKRTALGEREERANSPGWILSWSNVSASWSPTKKVNKGQTIRLDANEVIVPGTRQELRDLCMSGRLETLPLYENSFERTYEGR